MSDFLSALKLQVAANCSLAAALVKLVSGGVSDDDKTSGGRGSDVLDVGRPLVRDSNPSSAGNPFGCAPLMETYGLSRHPDFPNVLEVNFEHFRTVRDVRRKLHGDWRSPLAGREVKP